jgi:uncharacterized protein (DUF1778 family)
MELKKTTNRTADARLTIRLSVADKEAIVSKALAANTGVADYIVQAALGQPVRAKARVALPELFELQKIGVNLNQAVRLANTQKRWVQEIEAIVSHIKALLDVHQS